MLLEICVEDAASAGLAAEGGAQRIELCSDLALEGLTPSRSLMREAREACKLPIMCMIRPRAGEFCHDLFELRGMQASIEEARELGMDGVVLGVLDARGHIDVRAVEKLMASAVGLDLTFHRAFDLAPDASEALEELVELGVKRVLTSGGAPTALEGAERLASLVEQAAGRIVVMPGGGVRAQNLTELRKATGANEFHSSAGGPGVISKEGVAELDRALRTV